MEANPVGWFEIYVAEMARAKAFFYTALFGRELTARTARCTPSPGPEGG